MKKLLLLFVFCFGLSFKTYAAVNVTELVGYINDYRAENGKSALSYENGLQNAADVRANEASQVWSHTRPDGSDYYTVDSEVYGENLSKGYKTAAKVFENWKASPSHNANLLGSFETVAISVVETGSQTFVSCEFGF
jgi:uncharacterized protein YkwD